MTTDPRTEIRHLLDRLCRLAAAEEWTADLNPSQSAALAYLARANRFSRSPSQVADYLSSTRGTVSQTLKALHRKGYVAEVRSDTDRRSISYDVTRSGLAALGAAGLFEEPLANYNDKEAGEHQLPGAARQRRAEAVRVRQKRFAHQRRVPCYSY